MKTEFTPSYINNAQRVPCHQSVNRVYVWGQTVEIERLWGKVPPADPKGFTLHRRVTRTYENVSLASLQRLHNAVAGVVNKGEARLRLCQNKHNISYEMEY